MLVLHKNGRTLVYPGQGFSNTKEDRTDILNWIDDRKYPLYFEMGPANSNEVLRGKKFVVLTFFNPSRELEKQTDLLKATAEAYIKSQEEDDGQVLFVWLDGIKHARYIYNVYGFSGSDLPAVVITDAKVTIYFLSVNTIKSLCNTLPCRTTTTLLRTLMENASILLIHKLWYKPSPTLRLVYCQLNQPFQEHKRQRFISTKPLTRLESIGTSPYQRSWQSRIWL